MGIFRFGFLDNILSRPLLSGFVNAVALFIMCEQTDTFFGIPSAFKFGLHGTEKIPYLIRNIWQTRGYVLGIGLFGVVFLLSFRFVKRRFGGKAPFLKFIPGTFVASTDVS